MTVASVTDLSPEKRQNPASLDARAAAESAGLLSGLAERCDLAPTRPVEYADHAGLRCQPGGPLRHAGSLEPAAAAG